MNETTKDFSRIPAGACTLIVGEFELGDNGEGAKSAPVRLVARSGKAIEHWFWGNVVHDLAGMHLSKPRLPIDYVHDPKEVIGYLNRFDSKSGDLVTSGALVPFKENDRATEIMHKMAAGVPYEASINFGGDGIKIEEIAQGQSVMVNGAQFSGPGIIIREWPLRGVAICPYGADANTDASASLAGNNAKTFTAAVYAAPKAKTEETAMSTAQTVEVAAQAETPKAIEVAKQPETVEAQPAKVLAEEAAPIAPAVDPAPAVEAPAAAEVEAKKEAEAAPVLALSREEFARIADEFGDSIAARIMRDGGDYQTALKLAYDAAKDENTTLRAEVAENKALATGTPVRVSAAPANGKKSSLFNTGK